MTLIIGQWLLLVQSPCSRINAVVDFGQEKIPFVSRYGI